MTVLLFLVIQLHMLETSAREFMLTVLIDSFKVNERAITAKNTKKTALSLDYLFKNDSGKS